MNFAIQQIWRQPTYLSSNCCFWIVDPTKRRSGTNVPQIVYPAIPSSIPPVTHNPELPVLASPKRDQQSSGESSMSDSKEDIGDTNYSFASVAEERRLYFPKQKDVIRTI